MLLCPQWSVIWPALRNPWHRLARPTMVKLMVLPGNGTYRRQRILMIFTIMLCQLQIFAVALAVTVECWTSSIFKRLSDGKIWRVFVMLNMSSATVWWQKWSNRSRLSVFPDYSYTKTSQSLIPAVFMWIIFSVLTKPSCI